MKILVTGGCGFIGSNLVRLLIEARGTSVVNLDKLSYAGNTDSLAELEDHPNYHFEQIDLAQPDPMSGARRKSGCGQQSLRDIFDAYRPDAVMHLAAESHVDRSIEGPGAFIQANIVGTYNLLQASLDYWRRLPELSDAGGKPQRSAPKSQLSKESFRFLHVSTDEVYGSLAADAPAFSEATRYDPHSPYAASKAAADHLVRAWGDTYGLPVLVTHCSNNYGPYQFPEKLIPMVILKCLRGEPIPVYGKGANIRDWLHVRDHAEALYAVLRKGRVGESYNIGGNNEYQNIDLVRMLCRILGEYKASGKLDNHLNVDTGLGSSDKSYEDLIRFVADRPGHDLRYAIDSSKLREELGWAPQVDFAFGLRSTVRWYLEHQDWWSPL